MLQAVASDPVLLGKGFELLQLYQQLPGLGLELLHARLQACLFLAQQVLLAHMRS